MSSELIGLLGFAVLILLLVARVPVGIAMILVSVAGYGLVVRPDAALARLGSDAFASTASYTLSVIPLFVLMGLLLAQAALGRDLYRFLDGLLWRVRGGLALATIGASSLFGAVSGSATASASTMSLVAMPEMRRYNYDEGLGAACIAVGGTLGSLIPPSAVLVLYGILTEENIGALLIGGILPGLMTTLLLMLTAYLLVRRRPQLAPGAEGHVQRSPMRTLVLRVWAVPAIFGLSMGGIYLGVFTPTEAGAVGAFLALAFSVLSGRLSWSGFIEAVSQTVRLSAMIFLVVIGGRMFGFFLSATGIPRTLGGFIGDLEVAGWVVAAAILLLYVVLGAFMDEIAILVIMTPIMYPIVIDLGFDGVWFGVLSIMMLLTGLLTPPVGIISFVVSRVADVPLEKVFRSVAPFWLALVVAALLVIFFPQIVLVLPGLMG
ncbi:TRAP transporter large permease [Egicoccus halophilus]|uniref:C4-dicarboxylate ABC transporter permease n=1 Tax=Egicoccus halophilus TaxID=1670830 RepID=A0A8J3ABF9_9ACTN|nr:TRAP transporter large permease [Egicoccus halophilus]GGI04092.1 C4-dicarboxylate ABC transporter permease [Egicoccus halophilus]